MGPAETQLHSLEPYCARSFALPPDCLLSAHMSKPAILYSDPGHGSFLACYYFLGAAQNSILWSFPDLLSLLFMDT